MTQIERREVGEALTTRAVDGLDAVAAEDWDALVSPGNGPLRHDYLAAWDLAELPGLRSRPVVAWADGSPRPVAAAPGHFYDLDLPRVRSPHLPAAVRAIRRLWPGFLNARVYELGSPTPLTNPFLVDDADRRRPAAEALIAAAVEEARSGGARFLLVQNFARRSVPAAAELARRGFAPVPMLPTAVVDLPYDSFDAYLGAMRASYRRRARRTLERSADLRAERLDEFADIADELGRLWRLVYDRASELKREVLPAAFFRALSDLDDVSVLAMRRGDGSIASFALLLADHPWLSFLYCGFEEVAGRDEGAYFRLLYEIVRLGIEGGFRQIDLGMTTLEPKLDVGGVPVPLFAWVKHRNPLLQRLMLALANGPLRPPEVARRNVFKEPPPSAEELTAGRSPLSD